MYNIFFSPTKDRPAPLYLHPINKVNLLSDTWYARRPVGIHSIEKFLKNMTARVGEEGKYTPHSLRANTATRLFHHGVDEQLIKEQTGHSSTAVRLYKRTSSDMKEAVSHIIQPTAALPPPPWLPLIAPLPSDNDFKPPTPKKSAPSATTTSITNDPEDFLPDIAIQTTTTATTTTSTSASTTQATSSPPTSTTVSTSPGDPQNISVKYDVEKKVFSLNITF